MKSIKFLAYAGAIALLSTAGLSSCNNQNNPTQGNYNGEVVKTEFSIALPGNVAGNPAGMNRMPSRAAQVAGMPEFNGIGNIILVPFAQTTIVTSTDAPVGDSIKLLNLTIFNSAANGQAKVYDNVSIPLTTSRLLFYGESLYTGDDNEFKKGVLQFTGTKKPAARANPGNYGFSLKPIQPSLATLNENTTVTTLVAYLNSVANATDGAKRWKEYTTGDNEGFVRMFAEYKKMKGLNSFNVARMMQDLYTSMKPLAGNAMADAIMAAISSNTYVESVAATAPYVVTLKSEIAGFPENVNLPNGSVAVVWDPNGDGNKGAFIAATSKLYGELNMAQLNLYTYPSSLWYYANSPIVTSNSSKKALYDDNTKTWGNIIAEHTDGGSVNTLTRAVAINDSIQYGVARLDVKVKVSAEAGGDLEDNNTVDANPEKIAMNTSGYPVSAVLVGGQKAVNFDFTTNTSATEYTIYDKEMSSNTMSATTSFSDVNHTLVLETAANQDVLVAIELTNNTNKDFYGADGLVPVGGKFYLVGKLTASAAEETHYKVFEQDFTTKANFTIKNLKAAYNTIPDLRTPQLELGLVVSLSWQKGHSYDIDL